MPCSGSEGSETTIASSTGGGAVLKKGPWTAAEDAILLEYVKKHGEGNWNAVQRNSGLSRCGKSCRLRWANHLRPNLKKGSFSPEEERLILELHAKLGNKWARMAAQMPGRTDNEIKNYWNTRIKRRQRAGLPLYPPDIQRNAGTQQMMGNIGGEAQFAAAAQNQIPSSIGRVPFGLSVVLPSSGGMFGAPRSAYLDVEQQQGRLKRMREDGLGATGFATQFLTRPVQAVYRYSSSNYGAGLPLLPQQRQPLSMKMELPSSQLYADGGGGDWGESNSGLLDALLEEAQVVGRRRSASGEDMLPDSALEKANWAEENSVIRCTATIPSSTWESPSSAAEKETNNGVIDDELSGLLGMLPIEAIPIRAAAKVSDWYSGDSGEISSSAMTDDEMGLEIQQQLATTLSIGVEEDHKWSNANPGVC